MDVKTIAVIGAGTMGRGIAYAAAFGGYHTILEDVSRRVLDQGVAWIRQSFEEGVARGKVEPGVRDRALALISTANNVENAIRDAELIIEAVPEELEMKLELFTIFDKFAKAGELVKDSKEFQLHLQLFGNRFDYELSVANRILDVIGCRNQRQRPIANAGFHLAARYSFFKGLANPGNALVKHTPRNIFEDRMVAAESSGVGDSPPHCACANHCDRLHIHLLHSVRRNFTLEFFCIVLRQIQAPSAILEEPPACE